MDVEILKRGFLLRVDFEHAPVLAVDEDRHVADRDDAMLAQHVGIAKFRVVPDVYAHDGRTGLQRAARGGMPVGAEADMTAPAGMPAYPRFDQQVALIRAVAQHLDVLDVSNACHLRGGVLQQALRISGFAYDSRERRQRLLIAQRFVRIDQTNLVTPARPIGFRQPGMSGAPAAQRSKRNRVPKPGGTSLAGRAPQAICVRLWRSCRNLASCSRRDSSRSPL